MTKNDVIDQIEVGGSYRLKTHLTTFSERANVGHSEVSVLERNSVVFLVEAFRNPDNSMITIRLMQGEEIFSRVATIKRFHQWFERIA